MSLLKLTVKVSFTAHLTLLLCLLFFQNKKKLFITFKLTSEVNRMARFGTTKHILLSREDVNFPPLLLNFSKSSFNLVTTPSLKLCIEVNSVSAHFKSCWLIEIEKVSCVLKQNICEKCVWSVVGPGGSRERQLPYRSTGISRTVPTFPKPALNPASGFTHLVILYGSISCSHVLPGTIVH